MPTGDALKNRGEGPRLPSPATPMIDGRLWPPARRAAGRREIVGD
jgi:hypothetical protein